MFGFNNAVNSNFLRDRLREYSCGTRNTLFYNLQR